MLYIRNCDEDKVGKIQRIGLKKMGLAKTQLLEGGEGI